MSHDDRDPEGNFSAKYPTRKFIDAVRTLDLPTTPEVADEVGCTPQNALYRLNQLKDDGRVKSEEKGHAHVWEIA